MRWVRHVACIERGAMHIGFTWGNAERKVSQEVPCRDGRIILIYISKIYGETA